MVISRQRIDLATVAGIALLLMPALTTLHELGGHAGACLALGGKLRDIGAFYVDCEAPSDLARRLVAAAGPGIDIVVAALVYTLWLRMTSDMARLVGWYIWLSCGFAAAGYFLYSGVTGIGDLGPSGTEGIGPLPAPLLFRAIFALGGGGVYVLLVKAGIRTLSRMIGTGPSTMSARKRIAHGFYAVLCLAALLASLLNPIGLFITLASAAAASFGGHAGLISIGFAPGGQQDVPLPFAIERSWLLIAAGGVATLAFAAILGPTISFG